MRVLYCFGFLFAPRIIHAQDAQAVCAAAKVEAEEFGVEFGTICECGIISDGRTKLTCVDTTCLGCNEEQSVCTEFSFGDIYLESGAVESTFTDVIYIKGRSQIILYSDDGTGCTLSINGVDCAECGTLACSDGLDGIFFRCSNVPTGDDYSSCELDFRTDGVLEVFNVGEFDVCLAREDIQLCGAHFSSCNTFTDCCSGRCANNQCRSATRFGGKTNAKLGGIGGNRGGAAGGDVRGGQRKNRHVRGL